jgi:hypothetical protein
MRTIDVPEAEAIDELSMNHVLMCAGLGVGGGGVGAGVGGVGGGGVGAGVGGGVGLPQTLAQSSCDG